MSAILYYITGHGYGHAVRSNQIIRALKKARSNLRVYVRTTSPEWLFGNPTAPVFYSRQALDVGIVQKDSLAMDLGETFRACRKLHALAPTIVEKEIAFVKDHDIRLILGDTPPLCFEIAARAAIPSISITNFTWDMIYRAHLADHPGFQAMVDQMTGFYAKTTLALTLPYPCDMSMFPTHQAIPWVARKSSLSKAEARAKFGLPQTATVILMSFGGLGLARLPWGKLKRLQEFFFVATGDRNILDDNLLILPDTQTQYVDLIRAVDAIVTKPGYGIVADVIAHQLPILYTDRGDFAEYPRLVEALRDCATAEYIPQKELLSGNIAPCLKRLLAKEVHWPAVGLDGAQVAAEKVLALVDDRR